MSGYNVIFNLLSKMLSNLWDSMVFLGSNSFITLLRRVICQLTLFIINLHLLLEIYPFLSKKYNFDDLFKINEYFEPKKKIYSIKQNVTEPN